MTTKTIVGAFDTSTSALMAVQELIKDGFMRHDVSVVASNLDNQIPHSDAEATAPTPDATKGAVAGGLLGGAAGLAASLMVLAIPGIGPVIALGPLVAALGGAGVGAVAGGLLAGLTSAGVPEEHAGYYVETIRRGGAVVTLLADDTRAERAAQIMRENGAIDIDQRVTRWRESGWTGWDAAALPYTREEAERERRVYGAHSDSLTGLPTSSSPERDSRRDSAIRR